MNRSLGSSPSDEARLPGFINISPPVRRVGAAKQAYQRARSPRCAATGTSTGSSSTSASATAWQEQKLAKHSPSRRTVPRESYLVTLCRQHKWKAALERLEEYPEETEPRMMEVDADEDEDAGDHSCFTVAIIGKSATSAATSTSAAFAASLYHESALYWLCSHGDFVQERQVVYQLLQALLSVNPKQAIISHVNTGHAALRCLVRNPTCTSEALRCLLSAMKTAVLLQTKQVTLEQICYQLDRDGLSPMDHILQRFHQVLQLRPMQQAPLELLQTFISMIGLGLDYNNLDKYHQSKRQDKRPSPLIRLLSLGNTTLNNHWNTTNFPSSSSRNPVLDITAAIPSTPQKTLQGNPILAATKYFLTQFPCLLYECSLATQCTPLHLALRNYGNDKSLLQCFLLGPSTTTTMTAALEKDTQQEKEEEKHNKIQSSGGDHRDLTSMIFPNILVSLRHTNQFGDLPLHVACSVGVPVPVLRLVLEGTIQATYQQQQHSHSCSHNNRNQNLCWTINKAGYTPVDLEWIRHMEDGKGLFMARTFYPLEASGIRKTWWKQDEFYRVLLQQAVHQAMTSASSSVTPKKYLPLKASTTTTTTTTATATSQTTTASATTTYFTPNSTLPYRARAQARNVSSPQSSQQTRTMFHQQQHHHHHHHHLPPQLSEQPTWDLLLHRIFLILQTAATGKVPKSQTELVHYLLHAACALVSPTPPSLPQPLLELILWMYPDQLMQPKCPLPPSSSDTNNPNISSSGNAAYKPKRGNLPLHYAVQPHTPNDTCGSTTTTRDIGGVLSDCCSDEKEESLETTRQRLCDEWQAWIQILLDNAPDSCRMLNHQGRLPLHMALVGDTSDTNTRWKKARIQQMTLAEKGRLSVVHSLVEAYPDSVNIRDPVSGLLPFQMGAASPHVTLDAVFYLLQRSPDAVVA